MKITNLNIILTAIASTLFFTACVTDTPLDTKYGQNIEKWSAGDVEYVGFHNTFKFKATLMNETAQNIFNEKRFEIYKWDESTRQDELKKLQVNNAKSTIVFMSFFTPLRIDDNLASSKSIWKIYLQTPMGRFEGKPSRSKTSATELYVLFPYHNRWATGYEVEFPVSIQQVQSSESTYTVTGPMGSKEIKFPAR